MLPIAGSLQFDVVGVAPVSIHGDTYYDLLVQNEQHKQTGQAAKLRVPSHALANGQPPQPGERVNLTFLMQQVTRCEVLPPSA